MKRQHVICYFLLIIPAILLSRGRSEETEKKETSFLKARIEYFEGDVTINGEPASFGADVPYGAVISTGTDSYCEIIFNTKNIFRVMESTVTSVNLSAESPEIAIRQGAIAAVFNKLDRLTREKIRISTPAAAAGIRGTVFFVKSIDQNNSYVCACNGDLSVSDNNQAMVRELSSKHHAALYFIKEGGETQITSAPLLFHSDALMEEIAEKIDEYIVWDSDNHSEGY